MLDQVTGAVASFTGDGGYDQDRVYASVAERHPEAAVIVPPRATAVPSDTAETAPTQRDRHLQPSPSTAAWPGRRRPATQPGASRGRNRPVQTGDRRRTALAHGRPSGDRGGRRRPCAQPHGGVWTPELRPHRLTSNGVGATASALQIHATRPPPRAGTPD